MNRRFAWLLTTLVFAAGCTDVSNPGSQGTAVDVQGIKSYSRSQLTKTTQELPPLDQGRLEIPTPEGWHWASQERNILARFHLKNRTGIPQIIVKLDAEFSPEITDVTRDNLPAYVESVQAFLDDRDTKLLEPVKPLMLGDLPWARYVQAGKLPNKMTATIERQILRTTRGGRTYVLELQVGVDQIPTYRNDAYAVAAGIQFLTPEPKTEPKPDAPAETPPESKPETPPTTEQPSASK